jgi:hypothetical protein
VIELSVQHGKVKSHVKPARRVNHVIQTPHVKSVKHAHRAILMAHVHLGTNNE